MTVGDTKKPGAPRQGAYGAVFLVMMSNLMLELLLTRIFSATLWYHFAFMAVSIALFGTTVGAVAVHVFPRHFAPERAWSLAARYALLYSVSVVLCTVALLRLDVTYGSSWSQLATLTWLHLLVATPFFLSGVFICLALLRAEQRVGAVYCADLVGAGLGCALFVPFMAFADGPRAALWLAAIGAGGAALMAVTARARATFASAVAVAALCVLAFTAELDRRGLQVHWVKGRRDVGHAFEKWNAFSRLTVDDWDPPQPFGWGFGARFRARDADVREKFLTIDNAAATVLTGFDGDWKKVGHLEWDVTALPFVLRPRGDVFIAGVGGGRDVLTALYFDSRRVVGAEVNADILWLLRSPFADFTGRIAFHPRVELVADEARSFIARSGQRFDVIQASLVDSWAAAANGAYVLSENALYTREAFHTFLDHLEPDGVLSVSRWFLDAEPAETLRLVSLAATVLRERGRDSPASHILLVRGAPRQVSVATLLVSPTPLSRPDIERIVRWSADKGFGALLVPGAEPASDALAALIEPREPVDLLRRSPLDLSAPTDDRPFFFNMLRFRDALRADPSRSAVVRANAEAVTTLIWLLLVVLSLSALFILAPLWRKRAGEVRPPRATSRLLYFGCVGFGFILIEIAQMQRLMIALGHPVYGLTVVLFSLLVAAGLGSLWTSRLARKGLTPVFLRRALFALLVIAAATAAAAALAAGSLEVSPTWLRAGGSVALLVPLGFVLGIPLASGLTLSAADPQGYRALYWGVNGAASVCGTVLAVMLSLAWGITATFGAGLLAYAACAGAARRAFG